MNQWNTAPAPDRMTRSRLSRQASARMDKCRLPMPYGNVEKLKENVPLPLLGGECDNLFVVVQAHFSDGGRFICVPVDEIESLFELRFLDVPRMEAQSRKNEAEMRRRYLQDLLVGNKVGPDGHDRADSGCFGSREDRLDISEFLQVGVRVDQAPHSRAIISCLLWPAERARLQKRTMLLACLAILICCQTSRR